MQMTQLVPKLGRNDIRLIGRDSFLVFMFLFALAIALILRVGLPALNTYFAGHGVLPNATISTSLSDLYPMLVAFFALFDGALLVGAVFGFVLLDEKDDNTIKAMLVTPVPLRLYVIYRVALPAFLAAFVIITMLLLINQALLPVWQLCLLAAGASLTASITALAFATFAENKVQGFALSKFGGIAGWAILIGWFIAEPWQWLIGLFPPFWVSKAYWMALDGRELWWAALAAGVVLQMGLVWLLVQRFNRVVYR